MSSATASLEIWNGHDAHIARACMHNRSCLLHRFSPFEVLQQHGAEPAVQAPHHVVAHTRHCANAKDQSTTEVQAKLQSAYLTS